MDLLSITMIAIGLAMDAFAVSITCGLAIQPHNRHKFLRVPLAFGGFQAIMPVVGWLAGQTLQKYIINFDHWVAFGLLAYIGGHMIYESITTKECAPEFDPSDHQLLLGLSIATSIDALAVGVTFAFLEMTIGSGLFSHHLYNFTSGIYIGKQSVLSRKKVEIVGESV
jgi:putative Mn2+ efflux pump MntP